ncbi:MAG: S9 family peptidase [Gammaproteobacteria bacterium]|nr:S9 family peptidase [Gammaproteobacteria bacterium]
MSSPKPPIAARKPHRSTHHATVREDPYHWLRDPAYPEVADAEILAYLNAENAYFQSQMAPREPLVEQLFGELKARQQPDEAAVPWRDGAYEYQWRYADAQAEYQVWSRWPLHQPELAAVFLDEPALAQGHDYFDLGALAISPSGRFLVYAIDTDGSERYTLRIKDLQTGVIAMEEITNASGAIAWANDSHQETAVFFYTLLSENWRPYIVKAHRLGTPVATDATVYEEHGAFFVGLGKTQSDAFILITAGDHVTSETWYVPAHAPTAAPTLIAPRRAQHEYDVEHHGAYFYIRTNHRQRNFSIVRTPIAAPAQAQWEHLIDGSDHLYVTGLTCFEDFFVVEDRIDGLDQIRLCTYDGSEHRIAFDEPAFEVSLGTNAEFKTAMLRLDYESMVTPQTVFDYHVEQRSLETRKVRSVPSGYDKARYATQRLRVRARDGVEVPVSIVYRRDFEQNGNAPLLLYGYGAYGVAMTPAFSSARLSLLDRGFAFAIAHVRGGDELGRRWYDDGKLGKRTNTFNDFVDVARALIEQKYTRAGRIAIMGGSAGGTLVAAAANDAPQLWGAVVAQVPFVDVLNTILDESLPLTRLEWPEWGNPIESRAAFDYIASWSPYDQIRRQDYPPMLVSAGINDPRVTYWEAAKYVAKLRHEKTDDNALLLKVNLDAGHGGKTGRYEFLREVAEEYAFVLTMLGVD